MFMIMMEHVSQRNMIITDSNELYSIKQDMHVSRINSLLISIFSWSLLTKKKEEYRQSSPLMFL